MYCKSLQDQCKNRDETIKKLKQKIVNTFLKDKLNKQQFIPNGDLVQFFEDEEVENRFGNESPLFIKSMDI